MRENFISAAVYTCMRMSSLDEDIASGGRTTSSVDGDEAEVGSASESSLASMSNLKVKFFVNRLGLLRNTRKILALTNDSMIVFDCQSNKITYTHPLTHIMSLERTPKKPKEFLIKMITGVSFVMFAYVCLYTTHYIACTHIYTYIYGCVYKHYIYIYIAHEVICIYAHA
jgi:hypothetical protein